MVEGHGGKTGFEVLDKSRYRGIILFITLLTAIGAFTDSYNQFTVTGSTFSLIQYFGTKDAVSLSLAFFFIGSLIGALVWGRIADVIGRRLVFVIDLVILAVFALISGWLTTNMTELFIFRFIMGLAAGGDYPAALSLLDEFAPSHLRGRLNFVLWELFLIAAIVGALVGYALYGVYGFAQNQWRVTLATGAIPAAVGVVLRLAVPESPRWLAMKGRIEDSAKVISKVSGTTVDASTIVVPKKRKTDLRTFFSRQYAGIALGLLFAVFFVNFTPGTLGTEAPIVLAAAGFSKVDALLGSIIFEFIPWVISGFVVMAIGDRLSRVSFFLIGSVGMAVVDFLMLLFHGNVYLIAIGVVAISFLDIFWFNVAMSWAAELYPTNIRGVGSGYGIFLNRSNGALSVFIGPLLLASLQVTGLFVLYGFLGIIGAIGGYAFLRTRGRTEGKSLESIEEVG